MSSATKHRKEEQRLDKARREYTAAIDDLFRIYDIHIVRRESIEGHDTILATLTPNPGVKPQTDDGKIMRHFKARAWMPRYLRWYFHALGLANRKAKHKKAGP